MKAWIAHKGCYECEITHGVFLDENKAKIWQYQNQSSDDLNRGGWLEEVYIVDDDVKETQLYVKYEAVYNGKEIRITRWDFSTEKEENHCDIVCKDGVPYYAKAGDYICKIFLEEENASEELARKTAAELIAKYKIEHANECSSLVDECLIKMKKEKNDER